MESITEDNPVPDKKTNFFKYILDFNDTNKHQLFNMVQYTVLALIPIYLVLKGVKYSIPEEDNSKGSLEIFSECLIQIILIIVAIWFIDRIVRYIPTYTSLPYSSFNSTNFLIPFLILLTTMQTKLGAKMNILFDRLMNMIGNNNNMNKANNAGMERKVEGLKVSQPLSGQNMGGHQNSRADILDNTIWVMKSA